MRVIEFLKDRNVRNWFATSMLPAMLPLMASTIAAGMRNPIAAELGEYIKMSDIIFMGLTVNIESVDIRRSSMQSKGKANFLNAPGVMLMLMSMSLVGAYNNPSMHLLMRSLIVFLIIISVYLNFDYNKRLWKNP